MKVVKRLSRWRYPLVISTSLERSAFQMSFKHVE
jgi:hypothetical protein